MSIASENAKQIRSAMEVHVSLNTNVSGAYAHIAYSDAKVTRSSSTDGTDISAWPWRYLADFQGDGFPLDGTRALWDGDTVDSSAKGVVGIRSDVQRRALSLTVDVSERTNALTFRFASGTGTMRITEVPGEIYEIQDIVVVPVPETYSRFRISITPNNYNRVELFSITPGIFLHFSNDNIIRCALALRSDLSVENPSFPVSEIEVQAYWGQRAFEALLDVDFEVPITYQAGFPGDLSDVRSFYLSEQITIENGRLTIKGEDASGKLDHVQIPLTLLTVEYDSDGMWKLYTFFRDAIRKCGIVPRYMESAPEHPSSSRWEKNIILLARSTREHVQNLMVYGHVWTSRGYFWPVFVDAGIPRITWSRPTSKWDIYETDCAELKQHADKTIIALETEDEYGLGSGVSRVTNSQQFTTLYADGGFWVDQGPASFTVQQGTLGDSLKVTAGVNVIKNFESYFYDYIVYGQTVTSVWKRLNSFCFRPSKTTVNRKQKYTTGPNAGLDQWDYKVILMGKPVSIGGGENPYELNSGSHGSTLKVEPIVYGEMAGFPDYSPPLYNKNNRRTGSFLWKGDPRMQPRDVFNFHRLDGTVETCTIESIELKHEGGGTTATISYRLGVV